APRWVRFGRIDVGNANLDAVHPEGVAVDHAISAATDVTAAEPPGMERRSRAHDLRTAAAFPPGDASGCTHSNRPHPKWQISQPPAATPRKPDQIRHSGKVPQQSGSDNIFLCLNARV